MFADVTSVACAFFSPETFTWFTSTREFDYADIYREQVGVFITKDRYHVTSFYDTSITLVYLIVFYGMLAWYFDNVLSHNRGVPKPKLFPLMPSFWIPALRSQKAQTSRLFEIINEQLMSPSKEKFVTAVREENRIFEIENRIKEAKD